MAATFTRQGPSGPLYVLDATYPAGAGGYAVAFAPDEDPATLPATLALADTWQAHPGTYAFLASPPTSAATFRAALAWWRAQPANVGARFVWLARPDDPPATWAPASISVAGAGSVTTAGLAGVRLRSLALWVGGGAAVTLSSGGDALEIAAGASYLTAGTGAATLDGIASPVTISFADQVAGCLLFTLGLDNTGGPHPPDLDRLDVGLRFFGPQPAPASVAAGGLPGWTVQSRRFPLVAPMPASMTLDVRLDPLLPTLPARTLFGLPAGTTLPSTLRTTTARALELTAGSDASAPPGFALAVRALSVPSRSSDPYYLVPSGAFQLGAVAGPAQLMGGSSAVEYVTLPAVAGATLRFFPGQAAYAAGTAGTSLTPDATTAWAYVTPPGDGTAVYHAQPDSATLYHPLTGTDGLLGYLELAGTDLPAAVTTDGPAPTMFPIAPVAGVTDDPAGAAAFEQQSVSPARKAAVQALGAESTGSTVAVLRGGEGDGPASATTPQGLYATFASGTMSIQLGQSQGGARRLVLGALQPLLAAAFQSNQLFLVATDQQALARYATLDPATSSLTISLDETDTWTFDVFSPAWSTAGTVLVLKFAGRSLLDLAGDTTTWALGATLNGGSASSLASAQQRLLAFLQDAVSRSATDPDFVPFATVAQDTAWNGVLVLDCDVPLDGLPEQMSGLAAGIDPAQFRAHHLGVNVTPVVVDGTTLTPQDSSLFGLVFYDDPADLTGTNDPYRFKVNTLKVRFENSAVVSFSSRIELLVNELFADPVTLQGSEHGNNLVLDGVYQRQGTTSSYVFATSGDNVFTATSAALDSVDVVKAQFVTVVPSDQAEQQGTPAESRFLLWGNLRFRQLAFDVLSFGNAADGSTTGSLAFANLFVDLTFQPSDPAGTSVYTFDATRLAIDTAGSAPRPASVFAAFPLTLTGFVHALPPATSSATPTTPASLGYLGVQIPLPGAALNPPWFGLVANLALGSAGALAAKAGFAATLLAAWAPGTEPNVAVGLSLPGTGGSQKLLSLESVLKLKIQDLSLDAVGTTYVLALRQIALSLLSLSFPPSGQTDVDLFADPSGQSRTSLGWYAAYAKPKTATS